APRSIRRPAGHGGSASVAADRFWDRAAETMPRDALERLQVARVRSCVARLQASGAEFYRRRLADVSPDDLGSIEDLARLPFTTKNDLREQYPFGLLAAPSGEIVRIHASSGSTGKPTVVAYTRADLALWANVLARGLVAGGRSRMAPAMRQEIEERMGVRVYEQFGLSEIIGPGVASACERQQGLHVWEDHFIPEIIDPDSGERLPDGEIGELVLTAAAKEA